MKRTAVVLCAVLAGVSSFVMAQSPPVQKIGFFDAGRLSAETDLGKTVSTQLTGMQEKKRSELQAKAKEIQALQGQLEAQALSLSPDRRNALEKDIQRKSLELNQAQEAARSEMQIEVNEAQEKFQIKMEAAIAQFSRDEKFAMVLEKNVIAYADPSLDVTTAVVDLFNRLFPVEPPAGEKSAEKK